MTPVTITYITGRRIPRWEWFVESLYSQTTPEQREQIQLIFIDREKWWDTLTTPEQSSVSLVSPGSSPIRGNELSKIIGDRFPDVLHIPPKPCAWQGPYRQTKRDWFCAGNTRNTAFIVAKHPYVVFVDDLSVLMPGWFDQVLHAVQDQYVVCGMYKKVKQLKVIDGKVESYEPFPPGIDSRWNHGSDGGVIPWHGSGMFGCSFGTPLEAALEVDGNDRATDGGGAEDYDFGIRLERAGWPFFLNRNMLTLESEEDHHTEDSLPRAAKLVTSNFLPKGYTGNPMSDHVMLYRVRNDDRILPLLGDDLRVLRDQYQKTGLVPVPPPDQCDWRDGTPLKDL